MKVYYCPPTPPLSLTAHSTSANSTSKPPHLLQRALHDRDLSSANASDDSDRSGGNAAHDRDGSHGPHALEPMCDYWLPHARVLRGL
eukprot:1203607-Rhodomonas_salina.2